MPARSSSITIQRATSKHTIQYNAGTDEILVLNGQQGTAVLCLRWDELMEAMERRIDDKRYRPISEEDRAREGRERGR